VKGILFYTSPEIRACFAPSSIGPQAPDTKGS